MIRKFAAVTALSLVLGGIQAANADTVFLYQGPPRLEFGNVTFVSGGGAVSNLQPSKGGSRTWHSVDVSVVTNGAVSTIDRVTLCLYKASELDDAGGNNDGDADELCGYTDGTGAAPVDPDPKHVISMSFVGDPSSLAGGSEWSIDGTNAHDIQSADEDVSITTTNDYDDGSGKGLTLNKATFTFEFAVSHAAANAKDWKIRVSTKTTSPGPDGNPDGGDDVTEGAVASSFTDISSNASTTTYGVFFFAAFDSTVRGQVNYGDVAEQSSVSATEIDTAQYWANDVVDISLLGTNFTYDDDGDQTADDTVNLITESPGTQKAVQVVCDVADSGTSASAPLSVPNESTFADGANILLTDQPATGETSTAAEKHDCTLNYGSGATFGNAVYSNTMTVGLLDGDIDDSITGGDFGSSSPPINPAP